MKRTANLLFLLFFLAALFTVPAGTFLQEKKSSSFWENRALATRPTPSVQSLLTGDFFNLSESYFSDHVLGRDYLTKFSTWLDLKILNKPVINDQVNAGDTLLNFHGYGRWDLSYYQEQAREMGDRLSGLQEIITSYGGYFCYLSVPQQFSYFSDRYPDYMDNRQWNLQTSRQAFTQTLSQRGIPHVEMAAIYDSLGRPAEYYSTVDHHYTLTGALVAYESVLERINSDTGLNLPILREGDGLILSQTDHHYIGSKTRKLHDLWPIHEKLTIASFSPEIPFTRYDNGMPVPSQVYSIPEDTAQPVLYTAYMGGDYAQTVICTDRPELPNALIFGESYTNALETVFWTSFNETHSLDLRYYNALTIEEYISAYQPDIVVCLRDDSSYLNPLD